MKKIVLFSLIMALVGGCGMAQRYTYMHENFAKSDLTKTLWDMNSIDKETLGNLYMARSNEAGGEAPEALFGYYPDYGLSTQAAGTFRLVSKALMTNANSDNYVSFRYYYEANKKSEADARSFGIAARKGTGEWKVCKEITALPKNLGQGLLVGKLPDDMRNTPSIQFCVFHKTSKDNINYLFYFDDIEFFAYSDNDYAVSLGWEGRAYTDSGKLDVRLTIGNTGHSMTSCKISYTLDGGEVRTLPVAFDGDLLPGETHTVDFKPEGWDETAYGRHTVELWLSEADGSPVADDKIVKYTKYLTNINAATADTYAYRPLVEQFSSSTCGPCAVVNRDMNPILSALGDTLTLVKYQMNFPGVDPYYTEECGIRSTYYRVSSIPHFRLGGKILQLTGAEAVRKAIVKNAGDVIYDGIWFDTAAVDAERKIHIVFHVKSVGGSEQVRLHTAVVERTTYDNAMSNGETEFHNVMMKMLPDAEGVVLDLVPDSVYTFSYVYDMTQTHMEEFHDLKVACFLQTASGDILQSAMAEVGSYGAEAGAVAEVAYMPSYICATDVPVGLKLLSMGGAPLTSVEITARVGTDGTPVVHDYNVDLAWGENVYVTFPGLTVTPVADSMAVTFSVTKVNGEAYEGAGSSRSIHVQPTDNVFKPLLEGFISAKVPASVALTRYLDEFEQDEASVIKFPMTGDIYTRSAYTRYAERMGVKTVPALMMNGTSFGVAADGKLETETYFSELLEMTQKNHSVLAIKADDGIKIGENGTPNVTGKLLFESAVDGSYKLYMFVVESETKGNVGASGEQQFKRIVQSVFPDEFGSPVLMYEGQGMFVLSRTIMASKVENYDNLSLVVVVKDMADKEVLQTAEFKIENKGVFGNEDGILHETLSVYPNPTSDYVYLEGLDNALVEVFDMNGRKVFGSNGVNGDYTLDVQGYVPGAYIVKVIEGTKVSTARVTVVR